MRKDHFLAIFAVEALSSFMRLRNIREFILGIRVSVARYVVMLQFTKHTWSFMKSDI